MKKPTVSQIKTACAYSQPHFFTRETMKFFNQTMRDFRVESLTADSWLLSSKDGKTKRVFKYTGPNKGDLFFVEAAQ